MVHRRPAAKMDRPLTSRMELMMLTIWLLIICTTGNNETQCIVPQPYRSKETCIQVGNAYAGTVPGRVWARCVPVNGTDLVK